jgi:hypothetical protein
MSFAPIGRLAGGQSDFLPREVTKKKPSKAYAFFELLCGYTDFKTALAAILESFSGASRGRNIELPRERGEG